MIVEDNKKSMVRPPDDHKFRPNLHYDFSGPKYGDPNKP